MTLESQKPKLNYRLAICLWVSLISGLILYPRFCCRFPATNPCGVVAKAVKMDQTWYVNMYFVYVLPTVQHSFMGTKDNWNLAFCCGISRVPKPNYLCVGCCWPSVLWYFNVLHFKTPYWLPARQAFWNGCSGDKKSLSSLLLFICPTGYNYTQNYI